MSLINCFKSILKEKYSVTPFGGPFKELPEDSTDCQIGESLAIKDTLSFSLGFMVVIGHIILNF